MTGSLPDGLHTGLKDVSASAVTDLMGGMPSAFTTNVTAYGKIDVLTSAEANGLKKFGINNLAYGSGNTDAVSDSELLGYETVQGGVAVISVQDGWLSEEDAFTFNGKSIKRLTTTDGYSKIIPLFLTQVTDWDAHKSKGWVKGFSVKLEIAGKCPIPEETDFAYYIAYVGLIASNGYKVTYSISSTDTTNTALPEVGTSGVDLAEFVSSNSGTNGEAQTSDITQAALGLDSAWTYTDGSNTATVTHGNGTATITFTFTKVTEGEATLLGTSCPECGITNP
jgi:hypothetical protein